MSRQASARSAAGGNRGSAERSGESSGGARGAGSAQMPPERLGVTAGADIVMSHVADGDGAAAATAVNVHDGALGDHVPVQAKLKALLSSFERAAAAGAANTTAGTNNRASTSHVHSSGSHARGAVGGVELPSRLASSRLRVGRSTGGGGALASVAEAGRHEVSPDMTVARASGRKEKTVTVNVGCKLPKVFASRLAPVRTT